jgi:uncharacterized protein YkwD
MTFWEWIASLFRRPAPKPIPKPVPPPIPTPALADLLDAVNVYRKANGKSALVRDATADTLAQSWAAHLYFANNLSHGNWQQRFEAVFPNHAGAENIAYGPGMDAARIADMWFNEPPDLLGRRGHRENMLGPYNRMGVGHVGGYWVAEFVEV